MGAVWSADKKEPRHGCCRSALSFSRADIGFAGSLASKSLALNVKSVEYPRDRQEATTWPSDPGLRMFAADAPPCSGRRGRCWRLMTRGIPASLLLQAGRSEIPRFDRFDAHQVEAKTADGVLPICSLPLHRQLGQVIGRVSWKRGLFPAKCPSPPSLASGGVTRMRGDPKGAPGAAVGGE